jgi:hypothetical protein
MLSSNNDLNAHVAKIGNRRFVTPHENCFVKKFPLAMTRLKNDEYNRTRNAIRTYVRKEKRKKKNTDIPLRLDEIFHEGKATVSSQFLKAPRGHFSRLKS